MPVEYDKLVRDRIPALIREDDEVPVTETVAELADVLEAVHALAALDDVTPEDLETMRREQREERGGFDTGVVLTRVE